MSDRDIASELSYLVAKKRRRDAELLAAQVDQPHQRTQPRVITGTRLSELTERLGGRQPLANGFIDRVDGSHEQ